MCVIFVKLTCIRVKWKCTFPLKVRYFERRPSEDIFATREKGFRTYPYRWINHHKQMATLMYWIWVESKWQAFFVYRHIYLTIDFASAVWRFDLVFSFHRMLKIIHLKCRNRCNFDDVVCVCDVRCVLSFSSGDVMYVHNDAYIAFKTKHFGRYLSFLA